MPESPADPAWNDALLVNPHAVADKRQRVRKMFAAIAPSYDLNNRLHSLWMDQRWRRQAVKLAAVQPRDVIIDVACGTGDLALHFAQKLYNVQPNDEPFPRRFQVLGIDFTFQMLPLARTKGDRPTFGPNLISDPPQKFNHWTGWINGDALAVPLLDQSGDVLSIAFGIRNVSDPAAAMREFFRVLRPGGRLVILEFSLPNNHILRALYNFYFRHILPRTATLISGDKTGAYKYLPESVNTFISRQRMQEMMRDAGFTDVEQFPLTFGICVCYRGCKP